jgi:hypothetical protein
MRELTIQEVENVNGAMSAEDGGAATLALAATAAIAGAPFAAGFGLAVGVGLLYAAYRNSNA